MTVRRRIERLEAALGSRGLCPTCSAWSQREAVEFLVRARVRTGGMPQRCPTCQAQFPYDVQRAAMVRAAEGAQQSNFSDLP